MMNTQTLSGNYRLRDLGGGWHDLSYNAMGTDCRMMFEVPSAALSRELADRVTAWTGEFEAKASVFVEDSAISRINANAGIAPVQIDRELQGLFRLCDWFHRITAGAFDPSARPLLKLWDFRTEHPTIPEKKTIEQARESVGWDRVEHPEDTCYLPQAGMAIDLGGIGKEYAVDRVTEMALESGVENVLVDFGRDVRAHGSPPEGGGWRIGLVKPSDETSCWAGVMVKDRAVTSSGNYLRYFDHEGKRYGHIIDPRTGYPTDNNCLSTHVIAPTCVEAGICSTSAMVLGEREGMELIERGGLTAGCIVTESGVVYSRGFSRWLIPDESKKISQRGIAV